MSKPVNLHTSVDGVYIAVTNDNQDALFAFGTTVPANGTPGFSKGCMFLHTDPADLRDWMWENNGTTEASIFQAIDLASV